MEVQKNHNVQIFLESRIQQEKTTKIIAILISALNFEISNNCKCPCKGECGDGRSNDIRQSFATGEQLQAMAVLFQNKTWPRLVFDDLSTTDCTPVCTPVESMPADKCRLLPPDSCFNSVQNTPVKKSRAKNTISSTPSKDISKREQRTIDSWLNSCDDSDGQSEPSSYSSSPQIAFKQLKKRDKETNKRRDGQRKNIHARAGPQWNPNTMAPKYPAGLSEPHIPKNTDYVDVSRNNSMNCLGQPPANPLLDSGGRTSSTELYLNSPKIYNQKYLAQSLPSENDSSSCLSSKASDKKIDSWIGASEKKAKEINIQQFGESSQQCAQTTGFESKGWGDELMLSLQSIQMENPLPLNLHFQNPVQLGTAGAIKMDTKAEQGAQPSLISNPYVVGAAKIGRIKYTASEDGFQGCVDEAVDSDSSDFNFF